MVLKVYYGQFILRLGTVFIVYTVILHFEFRVPSVDRCRVSCMTGRLSSRLVTWSCISRCPPPVMDPIGQVYG